MYNKMTATSNWSGTKVQLYFRNSAKKVNINIQDQNFQPYLQYTYDLFNNPEEFRDFAFTIYNEATVVSPTLSNPPTREDLLKVLYGRLQGLGFQLQDSPRVLSNTYFFSFIKNGILLIEKDPLFLSNQHGHDTHIIQLAYLASKMEYKFGTGSTLRFYKYMGGNAPYAWGELFDSPVSDDLSNPSVVNRAIRPLGLK